MGTVGLLAVIGSQVAVDLDMNISAVFAGNSMFYDKAEFAKATSRIALPLNLISAASPPVLVGLLMHFGSNALLGLATLCSCGALLILLWLSRRRPTIGAIAAI